MANERLMADGRREPIEDNPHWLGKRYTVPSYGLFHTWRWYDLSGAPGALVQPHWEYVGLLNVSQINEILDIGHVNLTFKRGADDL